jgi:hypothetical protein
MPTRLELLRAVLERTDMAETPPVWKDRAFALGVFAGTAGFLYQLQEMLKHHTAWADFKTPAGTGEVVFCLLCGLLAVGTALGVNVANLIQGFKKE